jgi:hypothetical protein
MVNTPRLVLLLVLLAVALPSPAQDSRTEPNSPNSGAARDPQGCGPSDGAPESKRILGIIPNYRTTPCLEEYSPISNRAKLKIAAEDSFDQGTVVLAAAFAGQSQLANSNPSFGQGVAGFARYWSTSYADFVIGDYMTEAIFPIILHQDPRYFRRGRGNGWTRLGYAAGQVLWTHNDSGSSGFNYSEVVGNSVAVAISNSYYADNRDASSACVKLVSQIGVDAASNVLKEFWPEISRLTSRNRKKQ